MSNPEHSSRIEESTSRFEWNQGDLVLHWPKGTIPLPSARTLPHTWFDDDKGRRVAVNCPPGYVVPNEAEIDVPVTVSD